MRSAITILCALGCADSAPTWSERVAPLVERSCADCHREGGLAPFALRTYEDAASRADLIARSVAERTMPPFLPDTSGACGELDSPRLLTDSERDTFVAWAAGGAVEGAAGRTVAVREAVDLADAIVVAPDSAYSPSPAVADDYRCFFVDPGLTEDAYVIAIDARPGQPSIVHHVILFSLPDEPTEAYLDALDALDATPGYTCFGDAGHPDAQPIAGWAPGTGAVTLPLGTGLRLAAGRRLVLQVHYHPAGRALSDRTEVALVLAREVAEPARYLLLANTSLELPPRSSDIVVSIDVVLPPGRDELVLRGAHPHMHALGASIRVEHVPRDAPAACAIDVPRWDFQWQSSYFFSTPIPVRTGDRLRLTCVYDNPRAETVRWGNGTDDEMCLAFLYVTDG